MSKVKLQPNDLAITPQGRLLLGQLALDTIRRQAAQGLSATGQQTSYDWRQSGRLLDSAYVQKNGAVVFSTPYATIVNSKRPFVGVAPQSRPAVEQATAAILNQHLVRTKKR